MNIQRNSIYSVTRKLDLASLLVFTAAYGFLFAFMNLLHFGPLAFACVAGFFTSVGISQAVLFNAKSPRLASSLTGAIYFVSLMLNPFSVGVSPVKPLIDTSALPFYIILGLIAGYFSGTCIGGVFLVIDYLRNRLHSRMLPENDLQREGDEE